MNVLLVYLALVNYAKHKKGFIPGLMRGFERHSYEQGFPESPWIVH